MYSIKREIFCSLFWFSSEEWDICFTVTPLGSTVPEIFLVSNNLPGPFSMRIGVSSLEVIFSQQF